MRRWLIINPIADFGLTFMGGKILAWILALVIGVILYFTFMKNDDTNLTGFKKKLYDFLTFKSFIIKKVLTFVYVILALYFTIFGALYLFVSPLYGLLYLVIYNLLARLGFEFIIAVIEIKENTDLDEDLDDVIIIDEDDIEFVDEELEETEEDEEIEKKPATKAKKTKKEE